MERLLQQLVNGITLGSIYALIALGYTMVYGIINLINFAHGDIFMLGAYIGFALTTFFNMSFIPALVISMLSCAIIGVVIEKAAYKPIRSSSRITTLITTISVSLFIEYAILTTFFNMSFIPAIIISIFSCAIIGVVIEKVAYKPIRNSSRIAALITAISVSLFIENVMMYFVSAETRTFPDVLAGKKINILNGRVILNSKDIYIIIITILLMIMLQYIIHNTKIGKAMRAVSLDSEAAQLMGINVDKTISYTFAIGSALAGAAGVLVGVYYNSIDPLMGMVPGLKAFIAAVIGGIGIIPGAMFGGIFLGLTETMVSAYGNSLYKDAVAFAILIIVLIIKPNGLFGTTAREKV